MQRRNIVAIGSVIAALALGYWAQRAPQPSTQGTIKVGAILPLTGGSADFFGEYGRRGLTLAQEKINRQGGINGQKLGVIIEDSQGDAKTGLNAMNKLIAEGHKLVIGDVISGVTLTMAPVAEQNKIIVIAPGSAAPKVSQAGDYIFRVKVSADVESKTAAAFIAHDLKTKNISFLYQNSDYGRGVFNAMKADIAKEGVNVVAEEHFDTGATDIRSQLTKLKATSAEVILVAAYPKEAGIIAKQAKEAGVPQRLFVHSGSLGPDVVKVAGPAADGLMALSEINLDPSKPLTKEFVETYRKKYNEDPELVSSIAYDGLMLASEKLKKCSLDTECIKTELYTTQNYLGVTGSMSFDKNGDMVRAKLVPLIIKNSQFVPYHP